MRLSCGQTIIIEQCSALFIGFFCVCIFKNSSLFFPKQPGESLCVDSWRLNCKSSESERHGTRLNIALTQFSESEYANTVSVFVRL